MKKALIVLLALAMAGGLFAQEVSFSGHVQTGMFIQIWDADDDVHVKADDDDANVPLRTDFTASVDEGDWGVVIGFRSDFQDVGFHNAYGWLKFIDMIKVSAGLIDDGVWGTAGELDDNVSTGGGLRVEVMPIPGLNVGAFFSYPDGGIAAGKVANWFQETAIGFSYEADLFNVAAALKLYSKESTTGNDDNKQTEFDKTDMRVIWGFGLNLIPGLNLHFDGGIWGLGKYSDLGWMEFYEEADFGVTSALTVGIVLGQAIVSGDGFVYFGAKPWVEFAVNDALLVGADVGIAMRKSDKMGLASIFADAYATYTIGGGSVTLGYGFENLTKDWGDSLDHYIKLIFAWDF